MVLKSLKSRLNSKSDSKPRHLVALDIGTEYVKALVGKVTETGVEVIGVGRARQHLSDMQAGAIADIAGVVENCDKALAEAERMANVDARDVVIGIAGELVKGATTTVNIRRSDPKAEISTEEVERLVAKVQERAELQARKALRLEAGRTDVDVRLVNSALVSIEIDGYVVTNPVGFQGKDVAIQLYTAFAPMIHIGALERTAQELDLDLVAVAAEPFAVARAVVGNDASTSFSAILIDVGGGTTDIAIVNEGGVEGTVMFGIGGRSFTRTIANDMNVEFDVAEDMKLNLSQNKSQPTVVSALKKTLGVWQSGIQLALSEFDSLDNLPNKILLCGGGSSLPPLVKNLEGKAWHKSIAFTKAPEVHHIDPKQVVGIVDKTDTINDHTYITALGLLRVGLDTIEGVSEEPKNLRDRFNKILSI